MPSSQRPLFIWIISMILFIFFHFWLIRPPRKTKEVLELWNIWEYFQRYPENRCSSTDQCTQQVLKGSSVHIFVNRKFKQNWLSNSQLFHFISNQFNFILLRFLDHRFSSVYNRWRPEKEWEMSFDSGQRNFYAGATISFHITEK